MKVQIHGRAYFGSPENIVRQLRERDHGRPRDVDTYMKRVASSLAFKVEGESVADRCEAFLVEAIRAGFALPVYHIEHIDGHAIRVLRKVQGFSKERLATQLGVVLMTINRWEDGSTQAEPKRFDKIRSVLFERASDPSSAGSSSPLAAADSTGGRSLKASRDRLRAVGRWPRHPTSIAAPGHLP